MADINDGSTGTAKLTSEQVKAQNELNELIRESSARQELLNDLAKERNEQLNMTSQILRDELDTMDKILTKFQGQIPDLKRITDLEKDRLKAQTETSDQMKELAESIRKATEGTEHALDATEALVKAREQITKELENQIEAEKAKREVMLKSFETEGRMSKFAELKLSYINEEGEKIEGYMPNLLKQAKTQQEIRDILEQASGYISETEDLQREMDRHTGKIANTLGLSAKYSETTLGHFEEQVLKYQQLGEAGIDVKKLLTSSLAQSLNLKNVFGKLVDVMKEMVVQLDSVGKRLGATTGMGNQFQGQIMSTLNATVMGGGTMEEASSAIGSLASGFSKFNPQAEETNKMLATTVVRLGKIGVGGAEAVKTMDFFSRTMRLTEKQSADLTTELALMGQQMGMTSSQIISDFQSVSNDLAIYGSNAINVFKDLEAQAKATGMQISSLVGIAKQFDTFDKAAEQAAQLNAVLGTQLSSLELMNMSYDERVNYLRQEVSFAVGNLDGLDQYTQQFVAQALGVNGVAEAQKFLNMSQAEYLKYQGDMAAANKRQEDLAKLTEDLVPTLDKFKLAFMKIATTLGPLIVGFALLFDAVSMILNPITKLLGGLGTMIGIIPAIEYILPAVAIGLGIWKIKTMELTFAQMGLNTQLGVLGIAMLAAGAIIQYFGDGPIPIAIAGVIALAVAFKLLNLSVRQGILGAFITLIAILGTQINPLFVNVFSFMAVGVLALAAAFALLNYSGGSLVLGLFVALAAAVALLVYSMRDLFEQMIESAPAFLQAGLGLYVVAGGIAAIALSMALLGPLGAAGLAIISLSMLNLGIGFEKAANGIERISKLSTALSGLGDNGLIAISAEGNKVSAVMGTGDVFQNFSAGKMEVEVKMPEMAIPKFDIKLIVDGLQFKTYIKDVVRGK